MAENLGQHFLQNKVAIHEIVDATDPEPGDIIIEVGTGHGELTLPLARRCKEQNCKVITIEKDPALAREFKKRARAEQTPDNITLIEGDVRELLPDLLSCRHSACPVANSSSAIGERSKPRSPNERGRESRCRICEILRDSSSPYRNGSAPHNNGHTIKLVGNLPYYLTNYLLRQLAEAPRKPERCVFTVQKEVAERMSAQPPNMNKLAASIQWWAQPVVLGFIHAEDFQPAPKVDSAIIVLLSKEISREQSQKYYEAVRALFRHPRKTIANNLALDTTTPQDKHEAENILKKLQIDPSIRPERLSIQNIASIAEELEK